MNIETATRKINELSNYELKHCVQMMDAAIKNYKVCIKNYSPEKMKKYGIPFLNKLEEQRREFVNELRKNS